MSHAPCRNRLESNVRAWFAGTMASQGTARHELDTLASLFSTSHITTAKTWGPRIVQLLSCFLLCSNVVLGPALPELKVAGLRGPSDLLDGLCMAGTWDRLLTSRIAQIERMARVELGLRLRGFSGSKLSQKHIRQPRKGAIRGNTDGPFQDLGGYCRSYCSIPLQSRHYDSSVHGVIIDSRSFHLRASFVRCSLSALWLLIH